DVPAGIAKGSRRRQREGGGVHPVLRRSQVDSVQSPPRGEAGPVGIVGVSIVRPVKSKRGREGEAALQAGNRVELPAAHQLIRDAFDAVEVWPARPERQLIDAI